MEIGKGFNDNLNKLLGKSKAHFNNNLKIDQTFKKVSTGSLKMDDKTGGGFDSGILTLYGVTESGKTSMALAIMDGALKDGDTIGLYVKAEGRLSDNIKSRYNIDFVSSTDDWKVGNCFEFKTNDYELVIQFLTKILEELPKGVRLALIVDSINGLRDNSGTGGMASTPRITADFLSFLSLPASENGHLIMITSQRRAKIQDKYTKNEDRDHFEMSGGFAIQNYSDWILQFAPHDQKSNQFFDASDTKKENPIGHKCLIYIKKSPNNTSNSRVDYPILYGRKGSEVWEEQELVEYLQMWSLVTRPNTRASFEVSPYVREETLAKLEIEVPEKFRSEAKMIDYFNENPEFVKMWVEEIKRRSAL